MPALSPGDGGDPGSLSDRKARDALLERTEKALKDGEDIFVLKLIARLKSHHAQRDWHRQESWGAMGPGPVDAGCHGQLTLNSLQTCLDYCLRLAIVYRRKEVVELLLKSGLHPDHLINCDCFDESKAEGRARSHPSASLRLEEQSSLRERPLSGQLPSKFVTMLSSPSCADCRPLILAVETKCVDMVSLLCRYNASVNLSDCQERTPLLAAVQLSPLPWAIVDILLLHGARIGPSSWSAAAPVDLMPELSRMQRTLVKELVHKTILFWKSNGSEKPVSDQDEKPLPALRIGNRYAEMESSKQSPSRHVGRVGQDIFSVATGSLCSPKTSRPGGLQSQSDYTFAYNVYFIGLPVDSLLKWRILNFM